MHTLMLDDPTELTAEANASTPGLAARMARRSTRCLHESPRASTPQNSQRASTSPCTTLVIVECTALLLLMAWPASMIEPCTHTRMSENAAPRAAIAPRDASLRADDEAATTSRAARIGTLCMTEDSAPHPPLRARASNPSVPFIRKMRARARESTREGMHALSAPKLIKTSPKGGAPSLQRGGRQL